MHEGHRKRMREKFLKEGLEGLQDHEKMEMILYTCISRKNTNEIGHALINTFGSFSAVFDAPLEELMKVKGIGESSAIFIKMIPQICRCYLDDKTDVTKSALTDEKIGQIFLSKFIGLMNENVMLLLMDKKQKFLYCGKVSEGSVNASEIYIRKIVELAMRYNASKAVIAHNHPSGIALPSREDLLATQATYKSLKLVGVKLIDHIIVADNDYVSLAQSNLGSDFFG